MKKAFTMIELIFVIVVIGILASIAIPKLTATRDDAKISGIIASARVAYGDFVTFYTSQNNARWRSEKLINITDAPLLTNCTTPVDSTTDVSPNIFVLCHNNVICLSFETIDEGNLTITDGTDTTSQICEAVKSDNAIKGLSNKTYQLFGLTVVR